MDYSPPDSSVHGISQAIILEWVAISYSRGSTPPRNQTHVSCISLIGLHLLHWLTASLPLCHLRRPICRVHHAKCWAGWITSWNQDCWEKYQQPQICRWYHSNDRKWRETKEPLDEVEKASLKLNIQKTNIMASGPITSWQIKGEKVKAVTDFIFWLPNHCRWWLHAWN